MTCRVPVAVPCRGLPTSYDFVWLSIFAWGVGSSVLNLLITIWALDYFGRERGPACKPACIPHSRPASAGPTSLPTTGRCPCSHPYSFCGLTFSPAQALVPGRS